MPTLITILIAKNVGALFTRGLYERACRSKQMPIIRKEVPDPNRYKRAEEIMANKVIVLRSVETVSKILEALKSHHNGFPVVNFSGHLIGLISRNHLTILMANRVFYSHPNQKYFLIDGQLKKYLKDTVVIAKKHKERNFETAVDDKTHDGTHSINGVDTKSQNPPTIELVGKQFQGTRQNLGDDDEAVNVSGSLLE